MSHVVAFREGTFYLKTGKLGKEYILLVTLEPYGSGKSLRG